MQDVSLRTFIRVIFLGAYTFNLEIDTKDIHAISIYNVDGILVLKLETMENFQEEAEKCYAGMHIILKEKTEGHLEAIKWIKG